MKFKASTSNLRSKNMKRYEKLIIDLLVHFVLLGLKLLNLNSTLITQNSILVT